ncbi:hypothetical protein [Flammeovirga sp. OC4]|uniref:IS66 family insertion sequence element accessory protein TnpA n=1 Tax=Flammeovirga sp. OC4 TaxID=1382345 RepID=UPI0005C624F2|nr:hypothetical protein [Flammeovirga sp. OC4]
MSKRKEEMYTHLEAFQNSGLTQKAYCELHSIKVTTFSYWITKKRQEENEDDQAHFIPVRFSKTVAQKITIEYPNGVKVHLSDRDLLQEAIHMY